MNLAPLAFSPGSITGFFVPTFGPTPLETVSRGLSFCVEPGVSAAIAAAPDYRILLNDRPIELPPVLHVLRALAPEPVAVHLQTPLPLGCGFGVSAAAALSTSLTLNQYFGLKLRREELGRLAHTAEVTHRTGIGDVAAQLCGGIVYRRCATGPFDCVRLNVQASELYFRSFGPLSTRAVLTSEPTAAAIVAAGTKAVAWLEAHLAEATVDSLLDRARQFAEETGLLTDPEVRAAMDAVVAADGSATMVMLGQAVLATVPAPVPALWTPCKIDHHGARLLP
jgi:pantoate kinase